VSPPLSVAKEKKKVCGGLYTPTLKRQMHKHKHMDDDCGGPLQLVVRVHWWEARRRRAT